MRQVLIGVVGILLVVTMCATIIQGCSRNSSNNNVAQHATESCVLCHNGSVNPLDNYSGSGIENPHPKGGSVAGNLACTECHGGSGDQPTRS